MPTTTPNFGWSVPVSTDLVKDGATAIELLGDSIDTSLVDLLGGTTGQVLAKASGTDMDFSWVAVDPLTILDAKGDLITATAADTPSRLAVGTNGQVLTADSDEATGLKWATAAGGGKVLQVVSAATSTGANITSASYTDTNITATITPTLATSKILVIISANQNTYNQSPQSAVTYVSSAARIMRGATAVLTCGTAAQFEGASSLPKSGIIQASFSYLDDPATTSATTYKLQAAKVNGTGTYYQLDGTSTITLMEIGA
jgi:hypothetical protein